MLSEPAAWLDASGPRADVILSTRVRLARNVHGVAFPNRATEDDLRGVRDRVRRAATESNYLTNALVIDMEEASPAVRDVLVERHLTSHNFAVDDAGRVVVIGEKEILSAMVNEEDHLRLQCIRSGLQPVDAWRLVDRIDREMDRNLHYAYSSDWGYLTACPTNVGTGVRVSVLAHLMGLSRRKRIAQVLRSVSKLGLSVRGYYGEGSAALGGFFQISNQTTLGQSEEDIAYTVERVASRIVGLELEARAELTQREGDRLADQVHRAYGILANARLVGAEECMRLSSMLRLGVALGLVERPGLAAVNRLLVVTQPGHLQYAHGGDPALEERDRMRADLVRRELAACD